MEPRLYGDIYSDIVFVIKPDESVSLILGEDEEFSQLPIGKNPVEYLKENYQVIEKDDFQIDGNFVIAILKSAKDKGISLQWECPMCGTEIDVETVCRANTPSAAISSMPDTAAVCSDCLQSVCFLGEEGWFGAEFNRIALGSVAIVNGADGVELWEVPGDDEDEEDDDESEEDEANPLVGKDVIWQGSVYDLVWGDEDPCTNYRAIHKIDYELMAKDSAIAYDFIVAIGQEMKKLD